MKDKKKIIVPLLLAGVTATGVVANVAEQQIQVKAETAEITNVVGAELKVSRFRAEQNGTLVYADSFNVGDKVYLPECTFDSLEEVDNIKYTIKKDKKEFEPVQDSLGYYFVAQYQGYYDITISAEKENQVVTTLKNLSVWVEREEATIKLPVNSQYVIPAKLPKNQSGLKIPAPSVMVEEDGKEVEKTANDLSDKQLVVYLVTPSTSVPLTLDSTKSFYAVDSANLATVGTYQIVYEYRVVDADDDTKYSVISRLESNFQVVDDYNTDDIKLKMIFQSSMPSKANVNTDISIPKVKVVDTNVSSTDAVNAYVKVIVKNIETNETLDVDYENFTFHPTKEGSYSVTYVANIGVFGDTCKTSEVTPGEPIIVTDSEAPKIIPTYAYEFNDEGEIETVNGVTVVADTENNKTQREVAEEMLVNRRVDIPSVAVKDQEFTIPAVYATDNFYKYSNLNDDIVITRTYRTSTGAVSTITEDANKPATIKFANKGNAEIRYKATDKKGNTLGEVVYDIVVYDTKEDIKDGKTTLKLDVGTKIISDRENTLTFAKPTATDTYDKNVDVKTYLKVGSEAETELTKTNSDGKYEIDIKEIAKTASEFTIIARATVDSTLEGTRTNLVTEKTHTVTILKASDDNNAPVLQAIDWNAKLFELNGEIKADDSGTSIGTDGYLRDSSNNKIPVSAGSTYYKAPFDQGSDIITLPDVQFTDNKDSNLSITVSITDRKGNAVSKVDQEAIEYTKVVTEHGDVHKYTVSGASFKLSSYGVYTVTYTAKDYAGNIVIKSFGIRVNDKTAPTITILDEDKFNKDIEVGEYFEVPTATLKKDGADIEGTTRWEIYNKSAGAECTLYHNGFIPTSDGTFYIRYYGVDELGNQTQLEDSMFTVTAKDTVAPTITLDLTQRFPSSLEWNVEEGTEYMKIEIPVAFATDKNRGQVDVIYSVTGPNNVKPTVSDHETNSNVKVFKATSEGKYEVVYSAVDSAGNESKVTKIVYVGDCIEPTLTWVNKDKDLPTEIKLNETYELKINDMLKLKDNKTSESTLREKISVTLTSPDGTTVTNIMDNNSGYEWKFTKTGTYTLKLTVKDEVGNSKVYSYTINVPSEEAEENKVSPVLGTVLVVLSVVVLAGVVVYFVASSKKKSSKKTSKKN